MKSETNGTGINRTAPKMNHFQGEGPNWFFIIGGALLSTLSIKLGCQLKQAFSNKQQDKAKKENGKTTGNRRSRACELHPDQYHFARSQDRHCHCLSEISRGGADAEQRKSLIMEEAYLSLPLVKVPAAEINKVTEGVAQASSPDCLELPWKPFHRSDFSDCSGILESGSDIYSKRELIQKLRLQLKRQDETIMEMQAQIADIQNSLCIQMAQIAHLQAQVASANKDLFNSEREVQQLRRVIADHCVTEVVLPEKSAVARNWHPESANGPVNGYTDGFDDLDLHSVGLQDGKVEGDNVEMFRREVRELKEVIEGKDFLLQSYKGQKAELCSKVKELQQKLASQAPNIL